MTIEIIYLVQKLIVEEKAIGFENYTFGQPSIIVTMNKYDLFFPRIS